MQCHACVFFYEMRMACCSTTYFGFRFISRFTLAEAVQKRLVR